MLKILEETLVLARPSSPLASLPLDNVEANIGNMWELATHKFKMAKAQGMFCATM